MLFGTSALVTLRKNAGRSFVLVEVLLARGVAGIAANEASLEVVGRVFHVTVALLNGPLVFG